MSDMQDYKNEEPEDPVDPGDSMKSAGSGVQGFIASLANKLPGRSVTLSVAISPEGGVGGGPLPIADGVPVQPVFDDRERPGVRYPGKTGPDLLVLVGTPAPSLPGPVADPPSIRYALVRTQTVEAPFPNVPGVVFAEQRYLVSVYRLRAGGQVFWESLPAGTILWNCPAP